MLVHLMTLVSFLLFRKILSNLRQFFGHIVYRPPPPPKQAKNCPYAYVLTASTASVFKSPTDTALEFLYETKPIHVCFIIFSHIFKNMHHLVRRLNQSFGNQILFSIEDNKRYLLSCCCDAGE